ncbi:hypothetical protein CQR38_14515, partial [Enterococcus faecium]
DSDKKNWIITSNKIATDGDASWQYMLILNYSHLNFKIDFPNKDDWKDIIKEVVVFASDDVVPFEIDSDWSFKTVSAEKLPAGYMLPESTALHSILQIRHAAPIVSRQQSYCIGNRLPFRIPHPFLPEAAPIVFVLESSELTWYAAASPFPGESFWLQH